MLERLAAFLSAALDLTVEEVTEVLIMGTADGLTVSEIVGLFQPEKVSFADMVRKEREFLADHEWSEKKVRFYKKREVA